MYRDILPWTQSNHSIIDHEYKSYEQTCSIDKQISSVECDLHTGFHAHIIRQRECSTPDEGQEGMWIGRLLLVRLTKQTNLCVMNDEDRQNKD